MAKSGDLHSSILKGHIGMIDVLRSSAKNKPVISSELILQSGYTLDIPESIDEIAVKRVIFSALAGNLKGLIFRQYRPEIGGREAPAWGLTTLDGKQTERLEIISKVGKVLSKNAEFLLNAKPKKAEIALLYNPENQIFAWASTGNESVATESLLGIHKALYERNFNVDFIHPAEFKDNILAGYKVLIIPFPYIISEKMAKSIGSWVNDGGLLISEAFTAGWSIDHGHHAKVIPGSGLDKVYQATQGNVRPINNSEGMEVTTYEKNIFGENLKLKGFYVQEELIPAGEGAVKQLGANNELDVNEGLEAGIQLDTNKETDDAGIKINGKFKNQETAVTIAEFGKGKAILIGTYIGIVCHKENHLQNANYLAKIIESHSEVSAPVVDFGKTVRVDVLQSDDNQSMIILRNQSGEALESGVNLKIDIADELAEQFSDDKIKVVKTEDGVKIPFYLEPNQIKVYFG
jgi:beta-galactosidase